MSAGFKVWNVLHNDFLNHNPHIAGAIITGTLFVVGGVAYKKFTPKHKSSKTDLIAASEEDLVPTENVSTRNVIEALGEYIRDQIRDILGDRYVKYMPLLCFVFFWILANNLIGAIPGFGSATADINTTLSMGLFIFLYYNIMGFREHGFHYLKHFTGHLEGALLFALGWVMFPLELISHLVRPMTLGMRLRTNIYADHTVYETISGLALGVGDSLGVKFGAIGRFVGYLFSALAPVPIVILGILVAVIQALVFTLLSSVYISIATAHEEH